jgi:hypothetical protein
LDADSRRLELLKLEGLGFSQAEIVNELSQKSSCTKRAVYKDFETAVATTPEEIQQLGKAGWSKYDEMTVSGVQMHFYRKPKRFGA